MKIDVLVNDQAQIGESPVWVADERALYWVDIKLPALYRLRLANGERDKWRLPNDVGAFALLDDRTGAVVALRQGICKLDFATAAVTTLAAAPFDPELFRFNEGLCDEAGRFWVGVMFDPLTPQGPDQSFALHSFTLAEGLRPAHDRAELHNGMAWSADGHTFYLAHSDAQTIFAFAYDGASGTIGQRRTFAEVRMQDGLPDGAAVDEEGGYWCALHGGGGLRRYTAEGGVDREIELPVSQPTMCAFGGDALDTLYVTTAAEKLSPEQHRREPLAGAILSLRPGVRGIPRPFTVR